MPRAPRLPLSARQAAGLVRALDGAIEPDADAGGGSESLPRIPEKVVRELVAAVRREEPSDAGQARWRARRAGAATGLAGALGALPGEGLQLVEEARAAVAIAPASRSDAEVAGDLLVVWGLVDDTATAVAMCQGTSDGSLLDALYARSAEQVRAAIPERWTPLAALKLLWTLRRVRDVRDALVPGGFLRAIPVVGAVPGAWNAGRDMKAFQKALAAHYAALAPHKGSDPA